VEEREKEANDECTGQLIYCYGHGRKGCREGRAIM
jgi:hypothetical protein